MPTECAAADVRLRRVGDAPQRAVEAHLRVRNDGRSPALAQRVRAVDQHRRKRNQTQARPVTRTRLEVLRQRGIGDIEVADADARGPGAPAGAGGGDLFPVASSHGASSRTPLRKDANFARGPRTRCRRWGGRARSGVSTFHCRGEGGLAARIERPSSAAAVPGHAVVVPVTTRKTSSGRRCRQRRRANSRPAAITARPTPCPNPDAPTSHPVAVPPDSP